MTRFVGARAGAALNPLHPDRIAPARALDCPPSNKRLKLAAPRLQGRIAFVITQVVRRSLGAIR